MSRSSLHDGATPIIIPEDEDNINPEHDIADEDVFQSLTIEEEKEVVWSLSVWVTLQDFNLVYKVNWYLFILLHAMKQTSQIIPHFYNSKLYQI